MPPEAILEPPGNSSPGGKVAALYVLPDGPYSGLPDVELWDEARDARKYAGPYPVVAHPPCARWGKLAHLHKAKPGKGIGEDGGCFASAVLSVREWGGVLEHPAGSAAFAEFGLPRPVRHCWTRTLGEKGWVTEVSQVAYGHRAQKRTWLYFVGATGVSPPSLDWSEPPAAIRCDWMAGQGTERSATPPAFRDLLLSMARSVYASRDAA